MKEHHYAYKIMPTSDGLNCSISEIFEEKMTDLLDKIHLDQSGGLYWVFKKFGETQKEPLCIVDCFHNRIYYHFSGIVDNLDETLTKLKH